MLHFRFIWVGKTRDAHLRALIEEYVKRLSRFVRVELREIRECPGKGLVEESRRILGALHADALNILLDVEGRVLSSAELANEIEKWQNGGKREVAFIIGGASGIDREVLAKVDLRWSLSRMTLTHEMARVLMVEQLYRGFTIIKGMPYQK